MARARSSTSLRFSHLYKGHKISSHFLSGGIKKKKASGPISQGSPGKPNQLDTSLYVYVRRDLS